MATYVKTDAGRAEVGQRQHKLPSPVRSLLLLVDGQRDVPTLRRFAASLHAPADALDQLQALGLITLAGAGAAPAAAAAGGEPPPSDAAIRYITLSGLMSEGVRSYLGMRGFMMQLRIERCGDIDDLLGLLPDLAAAIGKARSREFAEQWESIVRSAIA